MLGSRQHWMGHTNAHKCALFTSEPAVLDSSGCIMLDASVLSKIVPGQGSGTRSSNKIKVDTVCIVLETAKDAATNGENGGALLRIGIATRHGHTPATPTIADLLIDPTEFGSGPCVRHPYRIKDDMFFDWNNSSTTSNKCMCHCADPYFANQVITYDDDGVPDTDLMIYCGTNVAANSSVGGTISYSATIYYDDVE